MLEVCAIDPLLVLEPERLKAAMDSASSKPDDPATVLPWVSFKVPFRMLAQLNAGRLELADHDDPGNHWLFGQEGELFQLKFVGRHSVHSGFTSLIIQSELTAVLNAAPADKANRKQVAAGLEGGHSWLAFMQHVRGSSGEGLWPTPELPFLFAGTAIDCASVGVYTLGAGSDMKGLQLSSEYDDITPTD